MVKVLAQKTPIRMTPTHQQIGTLMFTRTLLVLVGLFAATYASKLVAKKYHLLEK